ncbi:hypothetical protein [Streptacidiphilus neutrinimicus]|uniref:hypothetical protein n=1 Tax=Streptacidiphilus neutrinimicus TaxID=105420 RepID=UPI0013765BDC|nr:hypothetical protein [Streptacidiphilus neutrinimicus]
MNELFSEKGMRTFTADRRDVHMQDASHYAQLADVVGRALAQQAIQGDKHGALSRKVRAWKVARHLRAMKRHSQKAAAASEALNAGYVNHVLELPQRRANAAAAKLERRKARPAVGSGQAAVNSLQQSLGYFMGNAVTSGSVQDRAPEYLDAQVYEYPMAAGAEGQGPRTVRDFFPRQDGRR